MPKQPQEDNALYALREKTRACEPDNNTGSVKRYDDQIAFDPVEPIGSPIKNGSNDCSCET